MDKQASPETLVDPPRTSGHRFRCAVLGDANLVPLLDEIVDCLASCIALDFVRRSSGNVHACANGPDAVVCAVTEGTPAQAAAQVAAVHERFPFTSILATAQASTPELIAAVLGAGAFDYFEYARSAGELGPRLRRAIGCLPRQATDPAPRDMPIRGFIGSSARKREVAARINAYARCDGNVLIVGETGSGKEICAQAIHYLSRRAAHSWVAVNCGAIPAELVENELFGHVRGAYTTAHAPRAGLVREAEGGTLFLDDVDCLPLAAQAKLLRFLQEREYRPVGSNALVHADVRVIAASNRDLKSLAKADQFRQDLYFRLNVLRIALPPLRDRREDIAEMALHFVCEFAREYGRPVAMLTTAALRLLMDHDWPGNVRELRHVVERAVLLSQGPAVRAEDIEIDTDAPPPDGGTESFSGAKARVVQAFERDYLERTLTVSRGNVTHAAHAARKDRRAFFELLRKHHIDPQHFRSPQG